ncbi:MAG: hypothetical protein ACM3WS_00510 [Bacillota bacterium]
MQASELVGRVGGRYAGELGIDLTGGAPGEVYKWFLAALLFGARISESIAARTYREFERARLLTPERILAAGWDALVQVLDRGGYVRYDFKTATKLLDINRALMLQYQGDLNRLHDACKDEAELERRLKGLGKGIGDITVNIFLRELRGIWRAAVPLPSERAIRAAKALRFVPNMLQDKARILDALRARWRAERRNAREFPEFEAALVRYGATRRGNGARRHG